MTTYQSATFEFIRAAIPKRSVRLTVLIGFWVMVGFLSSLHWWFIYNYPDPYENYWQVLRVKLVVWLGWGALTPLLLWLGHRFQITRQRWVSHILILLLCVLLMTVFYSLFYAAALLVNLRLPVWGDGLRNMAGFVFSMHTTFFFLAAIATILLEHGLSYLRDSRDRELRTAQLESKLAQAQWQNLRAQLNPHFLFNVLNTSASQLLSGRQNDAHETLVKMSELLRMSLEHTEAQFTSLSSEIRFAGCYLELVRLRFPDRLKVIIDVAEETTRASVPTLLLQPLVENAVKYGIGDSSDNCQIAIRAHLDRSLIVLSVSNNRTQSIASAAQSNSTGVGLKNLRERLRYLYQDNASAELIVSKNGSAEAIVSLPFQAFNGTI